MNTGSVREILVREMRRYVREMMGVRIPLGFWFAYIVMPLSIIGLGYIIYKVVSVNIAAVPPIDSMLSTVAHACIVSSTAITASLVASLLFIRGKHIYWSKLFYLAINDLMKERRRSEKILEGEIMDYIAETEQMPSLVVIPYVVFMLCAVLFDALNYNPVSYLLCYIAAHTVLAIITYWLYMVVKSELDHDYRVMKSVIEIFAGEKSLLEQLNIGIAKKYMALFTIVTLGMAVYYYLKRIIDVYQAHLSSYGSVGEYVITLITKASI